MCYKFMQVGTDVTKNAGHFLFEEIKGLWCLRLHSNFTEKQDMESVTASLRAWENKEVVVVWVLADKVQSDPNTRQFVSNSFEFYTESKIHSCHG